MQFEYPEPMKERIVSILNAIKSGTFERDEAIALSLLSALAGESIFMLGLPGVGKSMIARRLKLAFKDATVFEYLMSRFSTPDEIFGPVSISKLKDSDCYERITAGYLPEAEVVFLDEIWKAGPAIQNSLLTVLNEKIYLNGNNEIRLPLKGIISASNELPAEGEGLEALWDRFLIRYIVNPIEGKECFFKLLDSSVRDEPIVVSRPITDEDYVDIQQKSRLITIPDILMETIFAIHEKLNAKVNEKEAVTGEVIEENQKFYISDRRWKKAVGVIRVSAYLNGRKEVSLSDLLLLSHMLWNDDASIDTVHQIVAEQIASTLFSGLLDKYKSDKRHATQVKIDNTLFSPDGKNYEILCDDSPLKISIKDYERIKRRPQEVFFGAETAAGNIILQERGQFVIRFIKEGCLCINGYNYNLRTVSDNQLSNSFLKDVGDNFDSRVRALFSEISDNPFTISPKCNSKLLTVIGLYKSRFDAI